jgi:type IV secretion system protein VirB9
VLLALVAPTPVLAWQDVSGSRVRMIDYESGHVVPLQVAPGFQLMVELAPDERIENVAIGDSGAWQATPNKRGDRLFVKPIQAGMATNMVVVTDARVYAFELTPLSAPQSDMPFSVRFRYHAAAPAPPAVDAEPSGRYKLGGNASLRPSGMHDDGVHTYIEWPEDRALPAIYAIDDNGKETLVNGMMRDGRMVIDSVQPRLVFRIDDRRATASRIEARRP